MKSEVIDPGRVAAIVAEEGLEAAEILQRLAANTSLDPFPEGQVEIKQVVEYIADRMRTVSEAGCGRLERLEQLDPVSQSLVCELLDQIEKQLWMFESSRP